MQIWLRGPAGNGKALPALESLPAAATYLMDEELRLFPRGKQTPVLVLKDLDWHTLDEFIPVTLPVSAMPGANPSPIKIKLVRTDEVRPTFALLTTVALWKSYMISAPMVRLRQLKFALSQKGEVLVIGQPLPPIKGFGYWLHKNMMIPSGYEFDPPVTADLVSGEELTIFYPDGRSETIPSFAFNPAERYLVRQHG
jgi:hypothetical protein